MMPYRRQSSADYPTWVGFIYVFNLVVGTGALTLPAVFAKAGWMLSLSVVIVLAIISYMTVTFVIETMACANAVRNWQDLQVLKRHHNLSNDDSNQSVLLLPRAQAQENEIPDISTTEISASSSNSYADSTERLERMPLYLHRSTLYYYKLDEKFELGEMAVLFFNDTGRMIFYLCIAIYLYGDLSIYSAAVAKSLRDVVCAACNATVPVNLTYVIGDKDDELTPCWEQHTISRFDVYRLFVVGFTVLMGPFAVFSVQKTKYIQMLTVIFRWLVFTNGVEPTDLLKIRSQLFSHIFEYKSLSACPRAIKLKLYK